MIYLFFAAIFTLLTYASPKVMSLFLALLFPAGVITQMVCAVASVPISFIRPYLACLVSLIVMAIVTLFFSVSIFHSGSLLSLGFAGLLIPMSGVVAMHLTLSRAPWWVSFLSCAAIYLFYPFVFRFLHTFFAGY